MYNSCFTVSLAADIPLSPLNIRLAALRARYTEKQLLPREQVYD
jgi:hypothetical protein